MKNYVITLLDYPDSVRMAKNAFISGHTLGWDLDIWSGVDGSAITIEKFQHEHGVNVNNVSRKCHHMMMSRPGVRGCFLSHWQLWNHCVHINQTVGIFEHDVIFCKPPPDPIPDFSHVLKLQGFDAKPPRPAGVWYEGARAYFISPDGADRLINWVRRHGALPADVQIGLDVVEITCWDHGLVDLQIRHHSKNHKHIHSFTWNLSAMARDR